MNRAVRFQRMGGMSAGSVATLLKGGGVLNPRNVLVLLLNGQRVDITCSTQTRAGEVFETVAAHINLGESFLFGLTYLKGAVC